MPLAANLAFVRRRSGLSWQRPAHGACRAGPANNQGEPVVSDAALKAAPQSVSAPTGPHFLDCPTARDGLAPREELIAGLIRPKARISPKFFYDVLGSHLFEAITELDEYYPTRTEAEIFRDNAAEMALSVGPGATLVDLGAGNCAKAASLFSALRPAQYVAIDISAEFVRRAVERLSASHPEIRMAGVGMDFSTSLDLPAPVLRDIEGTRPLFFYPGSSIGNFAHDQAMDFLRRIQSRARRGGLLIGVDLVKPADVLKRAYDDSLGVTAAFNRNILRNANRIAGTDFEPSRWRHVALFNELLSRVEMHLEATEAITVRWEGGERSFVEGERIHTESACKYTVERFRTMLRDAGFRAVRNWCDGDNRYVVFHAVN
jgi:dimethylhistidine N-methyltransferase